MYTLREGDFTLMELDASALNFSILFSSNSPFSFLAVSNFGVYFVVVAYFLEEFIRILFH